MTKKEGQLCLDGLSVMYSTGTNGTLLTEDKTSNTSTSLPSTEEKSLSKEGVDFAANIVFGESEKNQDSSDKSCETSEQEDSSNSSESLSQLLKKQPNKQVLSRYPSGLPLLWVTNPKNDHPIIHIPNTTMVDLSIHATETVGQREEREDRKKYWRWKTATTQYSAEWAVRKYLGLDTEIQYSKRTRKIRYTHPNGTASMLHIKGTSDYHGDMVLTPWDISSMTSKDIFILCIRFGTEEKVMLRGWITGNYVKQVAGTFHKEISAPYGGDHKVRREFFTICQPELFPMSLLKDPEEKKEDKFGF